MFYIIVNGLLGGIAGMTIFGYFLGLGDIGLLFIGLVACALIAVNLKRITEQ